MGLIIFFLFCRCTYIWKEAVAMYTRRFNCRNGKYILFQSPKYLIRSYNRGSTSCRPTFSTSSTEDCISCRSLIRHYISGPLSSGNPYRGFNSSLLRFYSAEGDGRNTSEDKHIPVKEGSDKGKKRENIKEDLRYCDEHARLAEQDQKEWLHNEKLSIESKKKESPFLSRREKFKSEFLRRMIPWEKITISWETFPYHIQ